MSDQSPEAVRLAKERLDDRLRDAEQRGAERERVNGRLLKLEDHAKSVNGQILRLANGQDEMNVKLSKIAERLAVEDGVDERLEKIEEHSATVEERSGAKRVGKWTIVGILLGSPMGIVAVVDLILQLSGGH